MREFGDIEQTQLPGVGTRYDFVTQQGDRVGVIVHDSGERELLVYEADDPDAARGLRLAEEDLVRLGEILGMSVRHGGA